MANWNGLDFFIFLIFLINTLLGLSRGAMKEIISFMCLSAALIISIKFTIPLANFMNSSPLIQDVLSSIFVQNFVHAIGASPLTANYLYQLEYSISLLICFVGTFSAGEAVLGVTGAIDVLRFPYAVLDRKLGAALGCTRGYVISVLLMSIVVLHLYTSNSALINGSFFINLFRGSIETFDSMITSQTPDQYQEIYKNKGLYDYKNVLKNVDQFSS